MMSKLQEKPLAIKREHIQLQKLKFMKVFFYSCGSFLASWIWIRFFHFAKLLNDHDYTFRPPLCTTCTTACTAASLWWSSSCCAPALSRTSTSTMCATPSSSSAPHSQLLHSQVRQYIPYLILYGTRYKKIECKIFSHYFPSNAETCILCFRDKFLSIFCFHYNF